MNEDDARDEIDANQMYFEIDPRRIITMALFAIGLMGGVASILMFNDWFYTVTHTSLFPGLSLLTLLECAVGLLIYCEFDRWATNFLYPEG